MKFSLQDEVTVKLTKFGRDIYDAYLKKNGRQQAFIFKKYPEKYMLCELFLIFGPHVINNIGESPFTNNEIELLEKTNTYMLDEDTVKVKVC